MTENTNDIIGALAILCLEKTGSIYGKWEGRMSAEEQRARFGCKPFGKLRVRIDGETEKVCASRKVCFGMDFEMSDYTWLAFEHEIKAGRNPFSLGRYSLRHQTLAV